MDDQKPFLFGLASAAIAIIILALLFGKAIPFWGYILVAFGSIGVGVSQYQKDKVIEHNYQQIQKDHSHEDKKEHSDEDDSDPEKKVIFTTGFIALLLLAVIGGALAAVFL